MIAPRDPFEPITDTMRAELAHAYPDPMRISIALRLAVDVDTCGALLAGRPVDPARLDPVELRKARQETLVRLVRPIDVLLEEHT